MNNIYDGASGTKPDAGRKKDAEPLRKSGIPKEVILYTADEVKSREIIAKAMAEMYDRMISPI